MWQSLHLVNLIPNTGTTEMWFTRTMMRRRTKHRDSDHPQYSKLNMDRVSRVLAQGVPHGVPKSYRALADCRSDVDYTTFYCRDKGRQSIEEKAMDQRYLAPCATKAVVQILLQISNEYPLPKVPARVMTSNPCSKATMKPEFDDR